MYIEREALINEINLQKKSSKTSYPKRSFVVGDVLTCIYTAPAADVAEVVRCKECKYRMESTGAGNSLCERKMLGLVRPDDFCSYGERKGRNAELD